ncbi:MULTISPECIES: phenylalanine--tRNA ligase subunit alpha [unclassified Streptomyces]|jgi:phenylalanyl-tRNA synthetase alpha chain|uniref:phenylalanine--tRNA ligase subunit alpha n=1 Tax=unclassified Streptomyces TaxID=2593676 RepID=UPI003FD65D6D
MTVDADALRRELVDDLASAGSPPQVEDVRVKYLGQKGLITGVMRGTDFSALSAEERRSVGQTIGSLKSFAEAEISAARKRAETQAARERRRGLVDLTMPGTTDRTGSVHPVAFIQMFLEDIFRGMGFMVEAGYEVEEEFYNFDALNTPADHPARDMHDTFWLDNGSLLRTHTSATQVRSMRRYGAPLRAIFPGRCFRYESTDASHETTFHQCEGLMVDTDVTVATVLGVMKALLAKVFERDVTVRLRPGYFPFVEPGFELDLGCLICEGSGCRVCKRTGWVELMPCGMVHPNVLKAGGIDPEVHSGFAFGLGLTRLAMMKFGIPDIRLFGAGDIRFYEQFPATV